MSDDLISRKAVIDLIESCHVFEDAYCLVDYINELPAAYDVDKVVEQMEEYVKESSNVDYNRAMIEAIEIVKSGGIEELSAKLQAANMERSAEECGGEWISCRDRLPDVEVSENVKTGMCKDNGERFLITDVDGYVYESTFWVAEQRFEDEAIAWQPLPEPYHGAKAVAKSCRNHGGCEWCRGESNI